MRVLFPVHLLQSFRFLKNFKQAITCGMLNLQGLCNENFSTFECSFLAPVRTNIEISNNCCPLLFSNFWVHLTPPRQPPFLRSARMLLSSRRQGTSMQTNILLLSKKTQTPRWRDLLIPPNILNQLYQSTLSIHSHNRSCFFRANNSLVDNFFLFISDQLYGKLYR